MRLAVCILLVAACGGSEGTGVIPPVDGLGGEDVGAATSFDSEGPTPDSPVPCDVEACVDGNPCTHDVCHWELGCVFQAHTEPCDDGDACTVDDRCAFGGCEGAVADCDDTDPCTVDACDPMEGCLHAPVALCTEACGDLVCEEDESCLGCPMDCGICHAPPACCDVTETAGCGPDPVLESCVCQADITCCELAWSETCLPHIPECGYTCDYEIGCGDGFCAPSLDENCQSCPEDCGPCGGDSNCCDLRDASGCEDVMVEPCVCELRPACCAAPWDAACVALAAHSCGAACESCGDGLCTPLESCETCSLDCGLCPTATQCCAATGETGCGDAACEEIVCADDPYCCTFIWDAQCGAEAHAACPGCALYSPDCGDGACGAAEDCQTCEADCGVCALAPCCAVGGGDHCAESACAEWLCQIDPYCCETGWDPFCVAFALSHCGCAIEAGCGDGECDAGAETCLDCPHDCGDCAVLPYCGDGSCQADENCLVCEADCGECYDSDCCGPQEGVGCSDEDCQEAVCSGDGFCCDTQWDDTCAGAALSLCEVCGADMPAVCGDAVCEGGETCGGCAEDCGDCVCGDAICSDGEDCTGCPEDCGDCPPLEDCCEDIGMAGCPLDAECSAVVCSLDPYCCDNNWDGACGECAAGGPGYDGVDCTAALEVCECVD